MKQNSDLGARLLAGLELSYVENGDKGVTVRVGAKRANTTSQTFYTYFGSKEAAIQKMHDRAVHTVLVDWVPTRATKLRTLADGAEALPDLISSFLELLDVHPVLRRFLIDGRGPRDIGPPTEIVVNDCPLKLSVDACVVKVTAVFDMALSVDGRPDGEDAARLFIAQLVGIAGALDTGFCKAGDQQQIIDLLLGGEVLA